MRCKDKSRVTSASLIKTEFGYCSAIFNGGGELLFFNLPTDKKRAELFIKSIRVSKHKLFEKIVKNYFAGKAVSFSSLALSIDAKTPFRQKVYKALRGTKRGETISYAELAKRAGSPKACRAVGSTLANNPIPLIIPCHRVIKQNGDLGNFSADGGLNLKRKMLELEGDG